MPLRRQFTAISALIIVTLCGYAVSALFGPLSPIASAALVLSSQRWSSGECLPGVANEPRRG